MASGKFQINGTAIKNPSGFKMERYNITTLERRADGKMVGDLVAKKLKFYFTYAAITGSELDTILAQIWDGGLFFTLTYTYQGSTRTATVYAGAIPSDLHRGDGNWVWKNVTFDLIEQ